MAFTSSNKAGNPMSDMNVTPLVDVMLVLLIIFMITAPMLSQRIQIDLPQPSTVPPVEEPPDPIRLKISDSGELYWNDEPLIRAALEPQLRVEAVRSPQPMLEIDANNNVQYQVVADVLANAKNAGMKKIGFVEQSNY